MELHLGQTVAIGILNVRIPQKIQQDVPLSENRGYQRFFEVG